MPGEDYLVEFPQKPKDSEERYYDPLNGLGQANVPADVSPSDVAREMFLPEDWGSLKRRQRRIVSANPNKETLTITVGPEKAPHRRLVVGRVGETVGSWAVLRSELLEEGGMPVAIVTREEYHRKEGVLFAEHVRAWFPKQRARLTFDMRNIRMNRDLDEQKLFTINRPTGLTSGAERADAR